MHVAHKESASETLSKSENGKIKAPLWEGRSRVSGTAIPYCAIFLCQRRNTNFGTSYLLGN